MNVYILEDNAQQLAHLTVTAQEIVRELNISPATISTFQSADQLKLALPLASKENVFILDLEINGYTKAGLDFSEIIRQKDELATIIFITVHDEFAYTTYKSRVRALDFIAKDGNASIYQELKKDFAYINEKIAADNDELFTYKSYFKNISIPINTICYFESNPANTHSSIMYTADNEAIQLPYNLRELESKSHYFYRAHRRYLVNLQLIKNVDLLKNQIIFYNDATCPVSRRRRSDLLEHLKN